MQLEPLSASNKMCFSTSLIDASKMRPPTAQMSKMTDIGSRSLFSPDQDSFRETVRKFFQKEIVPNMAKYLHEILIKFFSLYLVYCTIKVGWARICRQVSMAEGWAVWYVRNQHSCRTRRCGWFFPWCSYCDGRDVGFFSIIYLHFLFYFLTITLKKF